MKPYRIDSSMPMTRIDSDGTIYPPECDHGAPPCQRCYEAGKIRPQRFESEMRITPQKGEEG